MKKKYLIVISILFYCSYLFSQEYETECYISGEIFLSVKQDLTLSQHFSGSKYSNSEEVNNIFRKYNVTSIEKTFPNVKSEILNSIFTITCGKDEYLLINELERYEDFFNYVERVPKPMLDYEPNDYYYNGEPIWHLDRIQADDAWDIILDSNVKIPVCINDNGFDADHEDLIGNIVSVEPGADNNQHHGTAVSGLVGMVNDNGIGYASVAGSNVELYLYTYGDPNDIVEAADLGVRIINMSWSYCYYSATWENALNYAYNNNVLCVTSGSNCSCFSSCTYAAYPQSYDHVIGVAALNYDEVKRYNSSYGDFIDISAPGDLMTSTTYDNSYYHTGCCTSCASPVVSGVAALILVTNQSYNPDEIEFILENTTDDIYYLSGNQPYIGGLGTGRVNAYKAVRKAASEHFQNIDLTGLQIITSDYDVYLGENILNPLNIGLTTVKTGSSITIDADEIYLEPGFEVELGAIFEIKEISSIGLQKK